MYRLAPAGVVRIADGSTIHRGDPGWAEYLDWLRSGAAPAPDVTPSPPSLPPPVLVVTRFQARAALELAGLLTAAEAAIAEAHPLSRIAWDHAQQYRRDSPTVISIGQQLGLTESQLDELFQTATSITA